MDGHWSLKLLALVGFLSILAACGAAGDSAETIATTTAAVASTATAPMETTATTEATAETATTDADAGFDAAEYFNGKTVNVVITHSAGGGADLYGRFVATRLGDYIPGNPRVVVTNVGGVGGMRTVFDAPEADLVIGVTSQASALYTVSLDPEAPFDPTQIRMVGGTGGEPRGLVFFGDLVDEYDSLADMAGSAGPSMRVRKRWAPPRTW